MNRNLTRRLLVAVMHVPLLLGACTPSGGGDSGCGTNDNCTDEEKEGYKFSAVVDVKTNLVKGNVWVKVTDDRDGTHKERLNRLAPVSGGYIVGKRPERDIHMIVSPVGDNGLPIFAAGMGSVMCRMEYYGGPKDGDIIDVFISHVNLQEVRCIKPKGV